MISSESIKEILSNGEGIDDPFQIMSDISTICTFDLNKGRELVIRCRW